ncbi:MAG: efflux RND transporter periplasmic adaptor subunit [Akkermansia sp.]
MKISSLAPLLCLSLGISFLLASCKPSERTVKAAPMLPEYTVSTTPIKKGDMAQTREWVGKLVSTAQAPILPQIKGYIEKRLFTNGQLVRKGEVLYQVQDDLYLEAAHEARQQVQSLEASYKKAQQDVDYYKPLVASGSVSRQTYTDAVQNAKAAASSLASAKAAAAQADINLSYCTLRAPMDGMVGFARAFVGSYVSPASSALVIVNMLNPIRIYFSISEQDWLRQGGVGGALRVGAKLDVLLADGQTYPLKAEIRGVDNQVNAKTGSLMMDASVENPDELLRPGMYVLVRADMGVKKDVLMVPVEAVVQVQGKNMLLLYEDGGKVSMNPVSLGVESDNWVQVMGSGLKEGMAVISKGTQQGMMAAMGRARLKVDR